MVIMTKEKNNDSSSVPSDNSWRMTEELREKIRNANIEYEKMRQEFENQKVECPICHELSNFVRYEGSYTRGRGLFRCENGHEFYKG
jgi:transposase-like protein